MVYTDQPDNMNNIKYSRFVKVYNDPGKIKISDSKDKLFSDSKEDDGSVNNLPSSSEGEDAAAVNGMTFGGTKTEATQRAVGNGSDYNYVEKDDDVNYFEIARNKVIAQNDGWGRREIYVGELSKKQQYQFHHGVREIEGWRIIGWTIDRSPVSTEDDTRQMVMDKGKRLPDRLKVNHTNAKRQKPIYNEDVPGVPTSNMIALPAKPLR